MTKYEYYAKKNVEQEIETRKIEDLCEELKYLENRQNEIIKEIYRRIPSIKEDKPKIKMLNGVIFEDKNYE